VRRSREEEPALWSVPLLATLAVLLLTDRGPERMPRTRAQLLNEVVRDSVRRWAARRADATLPGLDRAISAAVLIDVFADIAGAVIDGGAWQFAHNRVRDRLQQHWSLGPGRAAAVAGAVLDHWDVTTGVFVTATARGPLTARTRLFAEIGEALLHTRDDADSRPWIASALDDPERRETVRLAAGLSPAAAAALAELAVSRRGEDLDLACAAWRDGADLAADDRYRLVAAQLDRLSRQSTDAPPRPPGFAALLSDDASPFTKLALTLAQLPLSDDEVHALHDRCVVMPERQRNVIAAVAAAHRAGLDPAPDEATLDLLEAALVTDGEIFDDGSSGFGRDRKPHGLDVLVDASLRLLVPARPQSAVAIARTAYQTTLGTFDRTEAVLRRRGLGDAIKGVRRRRLPSFTWDQTREDLDQPFVLLRTGLSVEPAALTASQAWHLDETGALVAGMRIAKQTISELRHAANAVPDQTVALVHAYVDAAGIPLPVVVAQLEQLHSENPQDPEHGLLFEASRRLRVERLNVTDQHLATALAALRTGNPWLITIALEQHLHAERLPDDHVRQLFKALPEMTAWARRAAAIALAHHRPSLRLNEANPAIRAGAAMAAAFQSLAEGAPEQLAPALSDPDLWVRQSVAQLVHDVPENAAATLRAALEQPATQWTCAWCDEVRPAEMQSCPEPARHSRPAPSLSRAG
jgi:hypothetical protein